ncbi:type IX secretion system sortase PorU [Flavobacteriaceae bacterium F08102]|nr:type IX secretion system sortase PorU [Flavobacteriaceae bacterium F08102]
MRLKRITTGLYLLLLMGGLGVYAQQKSNKSTVKSSVLSSGTWVKFAIDTTGVYKIDRNFLRDLGINTNSLDPRSIRLFGNGGHLLPMLNSTERYDGLQENAIFISGEDDGVFDANDYLLFYGIGPHDWNVQPSQPSLSRHENNIYSDLSYYYLTIDNGPGLRITDQPTITEPTNQSVTTYNDLHLFEEDKTNLFANGQQWFGADLSFINSTTATFNLDPIDPSAPVHIRVRGVTVSSTNTTMEVALNGSPLMTLNFPALPSNSGNLTLAIPQEEIGSAFVNTGQLIVTVTFNNGGNPSAKAYLDYIEVIGQRKLIANSTQFGFSNFKSATMDPSTILEYQIQSANSSSMVWDVTNPLRPEKIQHEGTGNTLFFKSPAGSLKKYRFIHPDDYYRPIRIEKAQVPNQNLHALQDIDYVIVTQSFLRSEANRLADYHRTHSGLNVRVIDLDQIYNEFSSGIPDLTAIRDFVRHLYVNASSPSKRIKYLCLFGDASYDFKDRIKNNNNIVPAFQSFESFDLARSYVTDDYFGMMDDHEGVLSNNEKQDVATGRFPVSTLAEAKIAVDKTLRYYATTSFGDWRNNITVVADDPDLASEFVLQKTVERLADTLTKKKPIFNLTKIYADAFVQESSAGGERYPAVNEAINNAIEGGTLLINYFGHGGEDGWANERILEVPQINAWNNENTLPLFITVTCEFSRFDNPLRPTAGEFVFLNPKGGSTSMITTTREIFISVGQRFNEILFQKLLGYNGEDYTIAEALMAMKNDPSSPKTSQRLFVYYLGDPAMKLAKPQPNIQLTKINGTSINQATDSLKALSNITLEGVITDNNNIPLTNFNGVLSATIFDKAVDRITLDNNNFGNTMTFDAIESKIFKGRASVKNGNFTLNFIVPKDIRIAYGKAKISFYAHNQEMDKSGVNQEITIGGINENAPEDTEGPTIQLFMDDESFVDGGNTSESPHFIALLEDASGLNTSITAVDHDMVAILDGNQANPYILNDFYETDLDDFTKGKIKFPFRNLSSGPHVIEFKCWDTYNNSAEATLNFVVVDNRDLVLSNVLNYPNPFINYTEFWFNHNKPNEPLDVLVQIFTVSGKLIKTISQTVQSENLSRSITWDGLDDFGNKIGKGVYVYKLQVRSTVSNTKNEKFEKLVILQ